MSGTPRSTTMLPVFPGRSVASPLVLLLAGCTLLTGPDASGRCRDPEACLTLVPLSPDASIPVYSSRDLTEPDADVAVVAVFLHGLGRNADDYFDRGLQATERAGLLRWTLVLAPRFQSPDDDPGPREAYWDEWSWSAGGSSLGPSSINSLEALDRVLEWAMAPDRLPGVRAVVLAGHSAGAEVVQRYVATSALQDSYPDVQFRYVVANAGSYLYPVVERRIGGVVRAPDRDTCPGYNAWPFGLDALPTYAAGASPDTVRARLRRREVLILLGLADTTTVSLPRGCASDLQGGHRLDRGFRFHEVMENTVPQARMALVPIPRVGHSSWHMFVLPQGRDALFGTTPVTVPGSQR